MSRKPLNDTQLEKLLYESSDSETDDHIELEDVSDNDSDDSVVDPDYTLDESEIEEAFENELKSVWSKQCIASISKRRQGTASDFAQAGPSSSRTSDIVQAGPSTSRISDFAQTGTSTSLITVSLFILCLMHFLCQ